MFFVEHRHGVVDGDDTDQPPFFINHRGRDQVVLVKRIGHIALIPHRGDDLERFLQDIRQPRLAARAHQFAQCHVAHRVQARVDHDDVIELIWQVFFLGGAQMVDGLAHRPMLGRHHNLALHQTTGGVFWPVQRLFNGDPVGFLQRVEDGFLLRVFQIFDQVDDIIAVQLTHRLGQNLRRQDGDDFLADRLVEFRQNLAVEFLPVKPD